jgi:serine/threonine-protein kinase
MPSRPFACDSRQIEQFLAQELDETQQSAFEQHLESCGDCRSRLEELAASDSSWSEARQLLVAGEHDGLTDSDGPATGDFVNGEGINSVLSVLSPTDDPAMIGRLASYEIVGVIGRGGMGIVLKGFDPRLNRYVAIKTLAPHLAASGSARRRFAREARAAAAVVHENVIAIHGVAEWQGLPYLVMPYVRGESLQKRLDRTGPLGVQEILRIGHQAAAGLAAAHSQGLVHRDIKPANILLEDGVERLQITDFGLARTVDDASDTRTGIIAGTPAYMSPEQARGDAVDARSDLFSLGSVLYQLCTGRPPFRAETPYGILRRITDTEPRPISEINSEIPTWLTVIVAVLHSKEPDARRSATELTGWLKDCLMHVLHPASAPLPAAVKHLAEAAERQGRPSWQTRAIRATRKPPVAIATVAVLVVAVLAAFGLLNRSPKEQLDPKITGAGVPSPASSASPSEPAGLIADDDPALQWDQASNELQSAAADVDALAERASQLWDNEPIRETESAQPLDPMTLSPDQEDTPANAEASIDLEASSETPIEVPFAQRTNEVVERPPAPPQPESLEQSATAESSNLPSASTESPR